MISDFCDLNFTLGNEDNWLEYRLMPEGVENVLTIAGSGVRVLALLARSPKRITCVDVAAEQLLVAELRVAALRAFDFEDYQRFWGYPGFACSPDRRKALFSRLILSDQAQGFLAKFLEDRKWESPLYAGRWERLLIGSTRMSRFLLGKRWKKIFEAHDLCEQKEFYNKKFPKTMFWFLIWTLAVTFVLVSWFAPTAIPKRNMGLGLWDLLRRKFLCILTETPIRRAAFFQLYFCGRLEFAEAGPPECDKALFCAAKQALDHVQIEYINKDVFVYLSETHVQYSFVSLSNVPSYATNDRERQYLQTIRPALSSGATVLNRFWFRKPVATDYSGFEESVPEAGLDLFAENTRLYEIQVLKTLG
jgi:S-adenosylmethionine-diacylglycerol 3-amino-3-carboxypropyl transferase